MTDKLEARCQVAHQGAQHLVRFFLLLLFEDELVGPQVSVLLAVGSLNSLGQIGQLTFQIELLRRLLDLNNVVQYSLVDSFEARRVLRALDLRGEVDLANDQLAQELQLTELGNARNQLQRHVTHLGSQVLILLGITG